MSEWLWRIVRVWCVCVGMGGTYLAGCGVVAIGVLAMMLT